MDVKCCKTFQVTGKVQTHGMLNVDDKLHTDLSLCSFYVYLQKYNINNKHLSDLFFRANPMSWHQNIYYNMKPDHLFQVTQSALSVLQ